MANIGGHLHAMHLAPVGVQARFQRSRHQRPLYLVSAGADLGLTWRRRIAPHAAMTLVFLDALKALEKRSGL